MVGMVLSITNNGIVRVSRCFLAVGTEREIWVLCLQDIILLKIRISMIM